MKNCERCQTPLSALEARGDVCNACLERRYTPEQDTSWRAHLDSYGEYLKLTRMCSRARSPRRRVDLAAQAGRALQRSKAHLAESGR